MLPLQDAKSYFMMADSGYLSSLLNHITCHAKFVELTFIHMWNLIQWGAVASYQVEQHAHTALTDRKIWDVFPQMLDYSHHQQNE